MPHSWPGTGKVLSECTQPDSGGPVPSGSQAGEVDGRAAGTGRIQQENYSNGRTPFPSQDFVTSGGADIMGNLIQ